MLFKYPYMNKTLIKNVQYTNSKQNQETNILPMICWKILPHIKPLEKVASFFFYYLLSLLQEKFLLISNTMKKTYISI